MKKTSLMALLIGLIIACASVVACSSDDNSASEAKVKANIVGSWQPVHIKGYAYSGATDSTEVTDDSIEPNDSTHQTITLIDQDIERKDAMRIKFNSDGTCQFFEYSTEAGKWQFSTLYPKSGTYQVSGTQLTINNNNGEAIKTYTVIKVGKNVAYLQYLLDDNPDYPCILTCRKAN